MKKALGLALVLGISAGWLGCQPAADDAAATPSEDVQAVAQQADVTDASQLVQVTLKVPNMV